MPSLITLSAHGAALCYAIAALLLLITKPDGITAQPGIRRALLASSIGAALHAAALAFAITQHNGLSSSFFDAISLTALIIVVATTGSPFRQPSVLLPVFLIAIACVLLAQYFGHFHLIVVDSNGLLFHIISSLSAYILLSLATLQAILLYFSERNLRKKSSSYWSNAFPPLETTENILFRLILSGWAILSLAIVSGFIFIEDLFAQHLAHKTIFSFLSWLLFSALLAGHKLKGWRGITAATWTIVAFTILVLAYFGSKFVLDVILGRL